MGLAGMAVRGAVMREGPSTAGEEQPHATAGSVPSQLTVLLPLSVAASTGTASTAPPPSAETARQSG